MTSLSPIPVTLLTGFLGSGKTTLLLNLLPQLRSLNPSYTLALLKNEFGDLAIDSQLTSSPSSPISSVQELLNGCICCNLVGELSAALEALTTSNRPDRIVIETSGSAFPATLAMEINRIARETGGRYTLDGVVSVIDVENWRGYEDTSYTAKIQARYTDLVVFNKWESAGEQRLDECLDRLGDLEVQVAWVKSDRGRVSADVIFGIDGGLARTLEAKDRSEDLVDGQTKDAHHEHAPHGVGHQSEVEVLSVTLTSSSPSAKIDIPKFSKLLCTAPKDEIYRIKAIVKSSTSIRASDDAAEQSDNEADSGRYIINWAFGRWTCTPLIDRNIAKGVNGDCGKSGQRDHKADGEGEADAVILRMTLILARGESTKWMKRLETAGLIDLEDGVEGSLKVKKIA